MLRQARSLAIAGLTVFALQGAYGCAMTRRPNADVAVEVGHAAPNFLLKDQNEQAITLSQFRGRKVVLAFYVFSFSPDCASELTVFQKNLNHLEASGVEVLGVSMDSPYANKAFGESLGVKFRLLSDRDGAVARAYGILHQEKMVARRTTYLIDESGKVTRMRQDDEAVDPTAIIEACTADPEG
jgi:mycoredoxin-dependent peroxiredoxin